MALFVSAWFVWRSRDIHAGDGDGLHGRPFAPRQALGFMAIIAVALLASTWLKQLWGEGGVLAAAGATGLADVHAAAITLGQLVSADGLANHEASHALALAFTTNSLVKCFFAGMNGAAYARPVIGGVLAINAAVVLVALLT